MSRWRGIALGLLVAGTIGLRAGWVESHAFNTDEMQHLHVAWARASGDVVYRDVFDHHMPAFHVLAAPLVALRGESPDVLFDGRRLQAGIATILLLAVFAWGATLVGARAAAWATILVALFPRFFLTTIEIRPDVAWAALAFAAMAVWQSGLPRRADPASRPGIPGPARAATTGLLLGAATAFSLKGALVVAAVILTTAAITGAVTSRRRLVHWAIWVGTLSLAAVPPMAAAFLPSILAGAGGTAISSILGHSSPVPGIRLGGFAVLAGAVLVFAARLARSRGGSRPAAAIGAIGVFACFLILSPPLVSSQTALLLYPLLAIGITWTLPPAALPVLAAAELATLLAAHPPWRDHAWPARETIGQALRLTRPGETVFDLKGEMIFRERAIFPALEEVTLGRLERGEVADRIPERILETDTCVVVLDNPKLPPRTRAFLNEGFVSVGRVRVPGRLFDAAPGRSVEVELAVPGRYVIVTREGPVRGSLDGAPYRADARVLEAGRHVFIPESDGLHAFFWARAWERGYAPFP